MWKIAKFSSSFVIGILVSHYICVVSSFMRQRKFLVIAGNFSIDDQLLNIAAYDISKKE